MNRNEIVYKGIEECVSLTETLDLLKEHGIPFPKTIGRLDRLQKDLDKYLGMFFDGNRDMLKVYDSIERLPDRINKLPASKRLAVAEFVTEIESL
jgi:hypothetical protein